MTAKHFSAMLVLLALAVASAPASAQFYAGASVGPTTVDRCDPGLTGCDDADTGLKVFAGSGINQNLAVEFGWVDLGELRAGAPGGPVRLKVDGIQIAALGILPLNPQWSAFGKVGFYSWDQSGSFSDDGTDIMFGLGATWTVAQQVAVRFEWERFDAAGRDIDMLSAGVQFGF